MASFSVSYLHDDNLVARAVRELWWPPSRRRELRRLAWFALGAAVFLGTVELAPATAPSTAMRVFMLAPAALPALWLAVIGLVLAVLPRLPSRRLRRLPQRTVQVILDDEGIDYATANERYRVVWSEVRSLSALETIWLFRLRNGVDLVLPFTAVGAELAAWLGPRATSNGSR
jgi:hypothetical protein